MRFLDANAAVTADANNCWRSFDSLLLERKKN
jgi:hypothetical protein